MGRRTKGGGSRGGRVAVRLARSIPRPIRQPFSRLGWRGYERFSAWREGKGTVEAADGLPVPPARLRVLVSRTPHAGHFLRSGGLEADKIRGLLAEHGAPMDGMESILDFGCGCGRIARHWAALRGPEVFGCDYNPELVAWCADNLTFMNARTNTLEPPFPFEQRFDLIYAISVFTHLSEPLQRAWIEECHRALRPGGHLLFTTMGRRYLDRLDRAERDDFERGDLVTRFTEVEGSNLCAAYHPEAYVARMLADFDAVATFDDGIDGVDTGSPLRFQDVHLARRPS